MVTADIPAFRNILNLTQLVARSRLGRKTFQSCPTFPSEGSHLSGCPKDNLVSPPTPPPGSWWTEPPLPAQIVQTVWAHPPAAWPLISLPPPGC